MLDVHPAHHAATTWRDFFIHIATIVIGLLIAVGLEQTVEAVHHRHQRAELRESLQAETEEIIKNTTDTENRKLIHLAWLDRRSAQVRAMLGQGQPLPPPEELKYPPYVFADDPIWRSAKTSGLVSLLPAEEINAYSEVELGVNGIGITHAEEEIARGKLRSFEASISPGPDGSPDWAHLTPVDLRTYLGLLHDDREAVWRYRNWSMRVRAIEDCIHRRDWLLQNIIANETKFLAAAHL